MRPKIIVSRNAGALLCNKCYENVITTEFTRTLVKQTDAKDLKIFFVGGAKTTFFGRAPFAAKKAFKGPFRTYPLHEFLSEALFPHPQIRPPVRKSQLYRLITCARGAIFSYRISVL